MTRTAVRREPASIPAADFEAAHAKAEREAAWWASRYSLDEESAGAAAIAALAEAANSFRPDGGASFVTFATLCVRRRLSDLARRPDPHHDALGLDAPNGEDDPIAEQVAGEEPGPEDLLLLAEEKRAMAGLRAEVRAAVMLLPPFERKVIIQRFWIGRSLRELSLLLRVPKTNLFRAEEAAKAALRDALAPVMGDGLRADTEARTPDRA